MNAAYYSLRLRLPKHLGEEEVEYGAGIARIEKEVDYRILFSVYLFDRDFCERCTHSNTIGGRVESLTEGKEIELRSLSHPDFGALRIASSPRAAAGTMSEGGGTYKYIPEGLAFAVDGLPSRFTLKIQRQSEEGVIRFERIS